MLLQKIEPYKCHMITEKNKESVRMAFLWDKKAPLRSSDHSMRLSAFSSNSKTLLSELSAFCYTCPSISVSAIRALELAWEGETAERLFSRSGFISYLKLYFIAVAEISLGMFVGYTYMHLHTGTEEWNGNTQVVFQSLAVVPMILVRCYCAVLRVSSQEDGCLLAFSSLLNIE